MIVIAKCTSCGAGISVDDTKDAGVCEYCKSAYVVNTAIRAQKAADSGGVVNIHNYAPPPQQARPFMPPPQQQQNIPPRPRINIVLAIFGLWLWVFPGVLYLVYKISKQHEWDQKYANK